MTAAFTTLEVPNLEALQAEVGRVRGNAERGYIFRGYYSPQPPKGVEPPKRSDHDSPKALVTGLERVCLDIDPDLTRARVREISIMREFRRRAHHYLTDLPELTHHFEWLALMQHHGAPTRFLDCTYSLHVALHFALRHTMRRESTDPAVWMVNARWCRDKSVALCEEKGKGPGCLGVHPLNYDLEPEAAKDLIQREIHCSVWPINPFRLNQRLTLQRGVFLAPADVTKPFATNLMAIPGVESNVFQFIIPRSEAESIRRHLHEANVTETTLFPGLDGFAKSLWGSARYLSLERLDGLQSI